MSTPAPKGRDFDARATAQAFVGTDNSIEAAGILQRFDLSSIDSAFQLGVITIPHGLGYPPVFYPYWRIGSSGAWIAGNRTDPSWGIGANGASWYSLFQEWRWSADSENIYLDWYATLHYEVRPAGPVLEARDHFARVAIIPIPGGVES